ncbi:MAG: hypothetical protein SGJ19_24720 [Planctomycetia bacterium]|nr:hypothetical protein [Planctomycetia bacterium]
MAKQSKTYRKIKDSSPTYERIDHRELESALGVRAGGAAAPKSAIRYPSLAVLQRQLREELVSEGGRPRRAGAVVTRRVPMTESEARSLDSLTDEVRQGGLAVTTGQVAGVLLRERLGSAYGEASLDSASDTGQVISQIEDALERILAAAASAKEELEALKPVAKELLERMKAGKGIESDPAD